MFWNKKGVDVATPVTPGLMKELPFFKNEIIFNMIITMASIILVGGELAGLIEGGAVKGVMILFAYLWVVYLIKFFFYMPRGDKIFVEKHYADSGVSLEVMRLPKDGQIKFKDKNIPPVAIDRTHKHFEINTGKPYVKVMQGHSHNYSALELAEGKMDKTGAEVASISSMSYDAGYHVASDNARKTLEWARRTESLIPIVMLIAVFILGVLTFAQFGQMTEIITILKLTATQVGVTGVA